MNKNFKVAIGILVLVLLSGLFYYYLKQQYESNNPASVNQNTAQPNTILIQDFTFNPSNLTVKAGVTVTWINDDSVTHTIKSNLFNSTDLKKGEMFSYTFNTTGSFDYICGIHPSMKGTVTVE